MRPEISPRLLAALLDDAPARVTKRLDADPAKAEGWQWNHDNGQWTVDAGSETVRLTANPLTEPDHASCSCLLSPRCGHLLAVATVLPLTDEDEQEAEAAEPEPETVRMTPAMRAAVDLAWRSGAELLATGVAAADTTARATLLRAVHACRVAGLHRLAAAGTALASSIAALAAGRTHFSLPRCAALLAELLGTAWRLRTEPVADDIGVGRRDYRPLSTANLTGLCSVPVLSGGGYGGTITYLTDGTGRVLTVSTVVPNGDPVGLYGSTVTLGRLAATHAKLGRSTVFAQGATATVTGRIGGGGGVEAASTGGSDWHGAAGDALWKVPVDDQLDRAYAALRLPVTQRDEGSDLLFLNATIRVVESGVELELDDGRRVRAVADLTGDQFRYVTNLRRMRAVADNPLRIVVRLLPRRHRAVAPLALWHDGASLNLAYEKLTGRAERFAAPPPEAASPLETMSHALHRIALGGRDCAGPAAGRTLTALAEQLRRDFLTHGAELVEATHRAASAATRDPFGQVLPADADAVATMWTAAMLYLDNAERELSRSMWS